jgi:hypothetical protein
VAVSCEHGNEILGPVKGKEFLEYLSDLQLFKDSGQGYLRVDMSHLVTVNTFTKISLSQ